MTDEKPKQVEEPKGKDAKDAREPGAPATLKDFQKDGETNLPDNPAYVAPESVDNNM